LLRTIFSAFFPIKADHQDPFNDVVIYYGLSEYFEPLDNIGPTPEYEAVIAKNELGDYYLKGFKRLKLVDTE
jgi:hypothetical protein